MQTLQSPIVQSSRAWLAGAAIVLLPLDLWAQRAPNAFPTRRPAYAQPSKVQITYGGNIIMDMGNYDIILGSPQRSPQTLVPAVPLSTAGLSQAEAEAIVSIASSPQIIFKGQTGLRWDGGDYLLHPAYPYDIVARYRYANRILDGGYRQYPPLSRENACVALRPSDVVAPRPSATVVPGPQQGNGSARRVAKPSRFSNVPSNGTTVDISEFCRQFPYAVQCRPSWTASPVPLTPMFPPNDIVRQSTSPSSKSATNASRSGPAVALPKPKHPPVVIQNPLSTMEPREYKLLLPSGTYPFTLAPGERHEFSADRDWRITFESGGMGTKTYRLRAGETYEFTKNKSEVWELHRLKQASRTADAPKSHVDS